MKKRLICGLLAAAMIVALAAGCTQGGGAAKRDDIKMFINGDISTLDPANSGTIVNAQVMIDIYDCLYKAHPDHSVEPWLAESYTVSDDSLTYTFKLNKGVKFHNGDELKASDVVFTFNRAMTSPYQMSAVDQIESVSASDDYTVVFKLKNIYAPFMEISICNTPICSERAVTEGGDAYGEKPVGTGPYKFVKHEAASLVTLTRFDDYFKGPAAIKDVTYRVIVDSNTSTVAVQNGEIDFGAFLPTAYENIKSDEKLNLYEGMGGHFYYVMMNNEVAPFDNIKVRQAINYAIDRDFILDACLDGLGNPTSTILAPAVFGYSPDVKQYEYNVEKAKQLLAEAGVQTPYDAGTFKTIGAGSFVTIATVMQGFLHEIGIEVEVEQLEQNAYIEQLLVGDFGLGVMGIDCGLDADAYGDLFKPEQMDGGNNMGRYQNPEVTELFAQGRATLDPDERLAIYKEVFNIVGEEAAYAPLFNAIRMFAYSKDLEISEITPMYVRAYDMKWK